MPDKIPYRNTSYPARRDRMRRVPAAAIARRHRSLDGSHRPHGCSGAEAPPAHANAPDAPHRLTPPSSAMTNHLAPHLVSRDRAKGGPR
jgi:hypothetical protein